MLDFISIVEHLIYPLNHHFYHIGLVAAEILQANDNLTQVINLYKQIVKGEEINGETTAGSLRGKEAG